MSQSCNFIVKIPPRLDFKDAFISRVTCYHVKKVINFVLVIHGHLGVAGVARHGVVSLLRVRAAAFLLPLRLERELHLGGEVDGAVHDEHGAVLSPVDVVALAVQTQHCRGNVISAEVGGSH